MVEYRGSVQLSRADIGGVRVNLRNRYAISPREQRRKQLWMARNIYSYVRIFPGLVMFQWT